jgi:dipeptidyl aminopeptidase/acylaminoacyl peptidase
MIEQMRQQPYPGSDITLEETLEPGANYDRYVTSYLSEGNKIYALLTVPQGQMPATGWPVIIFNHGYIPPAQYRTTERYVAYVDGFARNGYIMFRSDYRGHGDSEGEAAGGYGSPAYTIDVLNAISAIKNYPQADPTRIGMWGHSMGGSITLRSMVVSGDIKAGVIWAGVVASYPDLFARWRRPVSNGDDPAPTPDPTSRRGRWRRELTEAYGSPDDNPEFWASISPNSYLSDLSGPIQLHHGTADDSVPVEFSETLTEQMETAGQPVELYTYTGDNHNISANFSAAMQRSIQFFDEHVKNAGSTTP